MEKIPVKIVELTSPSGKSAVDVMIDVFDYNEVENVQEKIKKFKGKYFELVEKAEKLFYGNSSSKKEKYRNLSSSLYWKLGKLLRKFNEEVQNEFIISNYAHALLRDFGLSLDYIYDLQTISQLFKKNEVIDSVPISYYRILKKKNTHLKKLNVLEKEKKRLNKMGKEKKLPGIEKYKEELTKIIKEH